MTTYKLRPGSPEPMGVTLQDGGVNVAVFSVHATKIEFCLFDAQDQEIARIALPERSGDIHHGFIDGIPANARYGLRVHGPYEPKAGHRFNPHKLLVDPYATALDRPFTLHESMYGFDQAQGPLSFDDRDSAPYMPKAWISAPLPPFSGDRPVVPWQQTILYEMNLRGFTMAHPAIKPSLKGTFAALREKQALDHLVKLGATSIELMPAAAFIDERHLAPLGLTNAWGYNPVIFGAPDPKLAPGGWEEIRSTIAALHEAGLEVILDVVLNHSGESDEKGPTISFRGLDNASYYRLNPHNPALYIDDMGCGNCLALDRAPVVRLAMDNLRQWARAGIDGFRFDLAPALGRRPEGFDREAPLLVAIEQDPELRALKLIAEPWDIGPGGYQMGQFSSIWAEWNDKSRDTYRRFWRGDTHLIGEMATRLAGSQDLFATKRRPSHGINFVTAHDGFTLADLVSYAHKHNADNGENNRDGTDANHSWNHGTEGPTSDKAILERRLQDQRGLLATLLFSRGTPMLSMGAECGQSQQGNNNAYAQDNALSWLNWQEIDDELLETARDLIALRKAYPLLSEDRFLTGSGRDIDYPDVTWLNANGEPMGEADWNSPQTGTIQMVLTSQQDSARLCLVLHRGWENLTLTLPDPRDETQWQQLCDTSKQADDWQAPVLDDTLSVAPRSVLLFTEIPASSQARKRRPASDALIEQLATTAGIAPNWWDLSGTLHHVPAETKRALLSAFGLDYSNASVARDQLHTLRSLISKQQNCPQQPCYRPENLARGFGLSAQLYTIRRSGDQGIGDFTTLARCASKAAKVNADTFGINPLHALFPQDRSRVSPYHPSDRRFIDPIYIDIADLNDLPGAAHTNELLASLASEVSALSSSGIVEYGRVSSLKTKILAAHFKAFRKAVDAGASGTLDADFIRFVGEAGDDLTRFATFRAIETTYPGRKWQEWPDGLGDPASVAVSAFRDVYQDTIAFEAFQQWLADRQLARAAQTAQDAGLKLGYYRDLAVGCAPDGAEAWAGSRNYAHGVSVGAPPDPFCAQGQIWNLPPPNPIVMREENFASFRSLIAANMRHAGILRIDHVMGLTRLFCVPDGAKALEGAYISYPRDALLHVLGEESQHHRCMVVGEDLGTVPEGFRDALERSNILSYRVLWFEREGQGFTPPAHYPENAVACVATHDLPTLAGWWQSTDIDEQKELGLLAAENEQAARRARLEEKHILYDRLKKSGIPLDPVDFDAPMSTDFAAAVHSLMAGAPSLISFVQLDDLAGELEAVNLPGTDKERPNWRRKLIPDIENLFDAASSRTILTAARRS